MQPFFCFVLVQSAIIRFVVGRGNKGDIVEKGNWGAALRLMMHKHIPIKGKGGW